MSSFVVHEGDPASPVVVHVPHSATHLPADARASIVLDDAALALELARISDVHTAELASRAVAGTGAWVFENLCSRLVVDPERFVDGSEEMDAVGMGAVYTRTSHGEVLRAAPDPVLVERYFRPYADALADLFDDRLAAAGRVVLVDLHSYPRVALPYELHADERRPPVCLGVDAVHTPAVLLDRARGALGDVGEVLVDEPFHGTYVPTRHLGVEPRVASLMVELRRDTYCVEPAGALHDGADVVVAGLRALVSGA